MGIANKYNRGNKFDVDTTGFEYVKLTELKVGETYRLCGFYINQKGEYGASPVAILEDRFVNLPKHLLEVVRDMLIDDETIEAIRAGKFGFVPREYVDKKDKKRVSVEWCDL